MDKMNLKEMQLTLVVFKDDNVYNVYCPSLNLIGCGYSETEAEESFKIVFDEYINYTTEHHTLIEDLESLGWKKAKGSKKLTPPKISEFITMDSDFVDIVNNYDFVKRSINATIPL